MVVDGVTNRLFDLDQLRQTLGVFVKARDAEVFIVLMKLLEEVLHLAAAVHDGGDGEQFARRQDRADGGPFHFSADVGQSAERETIPESDDLGRLAGDVQVRQYPVVRIVGLHVERPFFPERARCVGGELLAEFFIF